MSDLWRFFAVAFIGVCLGWVWGNNVGWKNASDFYKNYYRNIINRAYVQKEGKEDERSD